MSDDEVSDLWSNTRRALAERGIVSVFLRFPPFLPTEAARLAKMPHLDVVEISQTFVVPIGRTEQMWSTMHKRSRTAVRAAEKNGCRAEVLAVDDETLLSTRELYERTMRRVGAADRYFFSDEYYSKLKQLGKRVMVARVRDAEGCLVAASFILRDEQHAHYHLSGSTGTVSGANNLMIWGAMEWASEEGIEGLHLGGGLTAGDSLHRFKAAFGGAGMPFHVGRMVVDAEAYESLVVRRAAKLNLDVKSLRESRFFPTYRAGVTS